MTAGAEWLSAGTAAERLEREFPAWTIRAVRARRGVRIEAVREDAQPGLYSVTGSFAEVRSELWAAS